MKFYTTYSKHFQTPTDIFKLLFPLKVAKWLHKDDTGEEKWITVILLWGPQWDFEGINS